jgi:hypothetical protein
MLRPTTLLAILLFAITTARAQAPNSIAFQGYLTDSVGAPLDSNGVSMTLVLYRGSTAVWTETQVVNVDNGVFHVLLGSVTPLDTVAFDDPIDLGITVNGGAELTPRTALTSAAYALGLRGLSAVWGENVAGSQSYNLVGGYRQNSVGAGVVGATISGGGGKFGDSPLVPNEVTGDFGTVSGGFSNRAGAGNGATVGGGISNYASGLRSTVAGGNSNQASGSYSTVPGGYSNFATADYSFAAGHKAFAEHSGTFVWSDSDFASFSSTGPDQFLIQAAGGVGIGTAAPIAALHVVRNINAAGSVGNHVILVDNPSTGTNGDGLAIRLGAPDPGAANNFISFFDGASVAYGRIDGNGSNGVVYGTTGGDYAEYLPRHNPNERIRPGDIVAVVGGSVTRETSRADRLMVITDRPAVLGNMPEPAREELYERVAFLGQVPVNVVGPVESGDFLVPSGQSDGIAVARSPLELRPAELDHIVGVAWESNANAGLKKVIAEVGLDRARATRLAFENELAQLWTIVRAQQERMEVLEESREP